MRYKVVPEPRSVAFLREAAETLPLVPGSVEDCCSRIRDETDVLSRDRAREYLTLLEALGLAEETSSGYRRLRDQPDDATLTERFRERVFGVEELLAALSAEGPIDVDGAFDALADEVPRWERDRREDWESEWRERTERLLEWSVAFGLAERDGDEYHPAS
ncbi:hypothetical protein [Halomicrobium urmianum]|uniref:hypothetical protein n=1 Tax=Halomicrobium urmianum TaxID=1586233 RepID=UPI001CD954D7|nr:hypothetical protein [Halomicrobium urmianum]